MHPSKLVKPFFIGLSGGAASGKFQACQRIKELLSKKSKDTKAIILSMCSFYRELSEEEMELAKKGEFDYDHPNSFDFKYLLEVIHKIQRREKVTLHIYDHRTYSNSANVLEIPEDVDVVIFEGILTFYPKDIRDIFHLKIFVESDADTRLCRKVLRDVSQEGRSLELVLDNYFKYVKPAFEEFCLPTKKYADVILPRAPDNDVAIDLIIEHLLQVMNPPLSAPQPYITRVRNQSESCVGSIRPH